MKKLVTVTDKELINGLREDKDIILLYPLKSFCVGYPLEFTFEEIEGYVLINRILNDKELDELQIILDKGNFRGIVFEDIGILELIKDKTIEKILLLSHIACNISSINHYLDYVDSIVISSDLCKEEILNILAYAKKRLVLNIFGLNMIMYSRRLLLSNYAKFHNITINKKIKANIEDKDFLIFENEYGTCFYQAKYYNAIELMNSKNVLYYWYNPVFLDVNKTMKVIYENDVNQIDCSKGFLEQKTIYKLKVGEENG